MGDERVDGRRRKGRTRRTPRVLDKNRAAAPVPNQRVQIPVIVDVDKAIGALKWLAGEMDRRYKRLAEVTARNIDAYNKKTGIEKMPYLILVIDELADLMMAGFDDVEHLLCRLAQMARAVGIHLVVATQRPSVEVITGLSEIVPKSRYSDTVLAEGDALEIVCFVGGG